jgi:solute carrier family 35, member E1
MFFIRFGFVKASEPFFSAGVSILVFGKALHPLVYATLIPVVGGVGYACLNQPSFSLLAFLTALGSNLFYSMRASLSKVTLSKSHDGNKAVNIEISKKDGESLQSAIGTNLTPANVFALVTIASFFISVPFALAGEGHGLRPSWSNALKLSVTDKNLGSRVNLVCAIVMSGLLHYINQDVMFFCLSKVHPVTLAVGNAIKRVIIIMTAAWVFGNRVTSQVALGAAVSIAGVLLYSVARHLYENDSNDNIMEKKTTQKDVYDLQR